MFIRKKTHALLFAAALVLIGGVPLVIGAPCALAQGITTGTLSGTVVDGQGAVIPNANITALSEATGIKLTTQSNGTGYFAFHNVPIGSYSVSIEANGFAKQQHAGVAIAAGQVVDLGQTKLGAGSSTTVEVNDTGTPLLQTDQSQVSTNFNAQQLQDLTIGANLDLIVLLQPGVVSGGDGNFGNTNGSSFQASLSINGQRARSNNFEIDGQSNNDNSVSGPQVFIGNQDAIREVQVVSSNYAAQYGRNMGGVVNYITKNGENRLHGSGFEFYQGSFLSALHNEQKSSALGFCAPGEDPNTTGCAVPTVPRLVDNRWGGTLGGPILKDKLWFFGGTNWEHERVGLSPSTSPTLTPDPTGLATLQSAFPGNPAVTSLVTNGPYAQPGAKPAGSTTTNLVTGPNGVTVPVEFALVQRSISSLFNDQQHLGRIDWQPNQKDHIFIRYLYQNDITTGVGTIYNGNYYDVPGITHSVGGDWSHTFSPSWVNQVRYSFQQAKIFFQGGAQPACLGTALTNCGASVNITGGVGYGYPTNVPDGRTVKVTQVQDNANWVKGKHSVSFGGDFTYQNSPNVFLPDYNGDYSFSNFSSFLQGAGTLQLGDGNPVIPFTEPDFSLYVQDDYRILPSLTLNLGLRYEFYDQPVNKLHSESVAQQTGPDPFWNTALPLSATTYPYTKRNWKGFQPRLGFAFNPEAMKNLVIRGGYGIQYDPAFYNVFLNSATAAPVVNLGTINCDGVTVQCFPSSGTTGAAVRSLNLPLLPRGADPRQRNLTNTTPDFNNPRAQTYSLGMQYSFHNDVIVGATYIGNHVSRQFQSFNSNPYLLPVASAFPQYASPSSLCSDPTAVGFGRTNCDFGNVVTRGNTAFSNYNSLQLQLQTRAYRGLTTTASYTYSRVISNVDEVYSATSSGAGTTTSLAFAQNPLDIDEAERGVSNYSYPNIVSLGIVYELPFYKGQANLMGRLLGGFEVSPTYMYHDGEPWTAYQFYQATTFSDPSDTGAGTPNTMSYCDQQFAAARIGIDTCRPVLANAKAPVGSVGIYVVDPNRTFTSNGTGYYQYASTDANGNLNAPISKASAHWLYDNQAYANLVGNPYPGAPRNISRGQATNNLDATVIKNTAIAEGVSLKLYMNVFNVLNHQFLGTPDTSIDDGAAFGSTAFNFEPAAANSRFIVLGGKVVF
jgi:outer membrane receptor protein involved in Fe transport